MGTSEENVKLNRFANITVCKYKIYKLLNKVYSYVSYTDDHNRIVLHPLDEYEDHQGEFVNACFIDVRENNITIVHIAIMPFLLNTLCHRVIQSLRSLLQLKVIEL